MPELRQSFTVPHARPHVWAAFGDVEAVAACLPGASVSPPGDDGRIEGQLAIKLGPITASFGGTATLTREDETFSGRLGGMGSDRKSASRAKGSAAFSLHEDGPALTRVEIAADYTLTGPLAQYGRPGIVNELAARLCAAFAANLERLLDARAPSAVATSSPAAPTPLPPTPPAPAPLDGLRLLRLAIVAWLKGALRSAWRRTAVTREN